MADNPATRLHSLLEKLLKYEPRSTNETTETVIRSALLVGGIGVPEKEDYDKDDVLYEVFLFQRLVNEVIEWIEKRELDRELFKRPVERLWRRIMQFSLSTPWNDTKKTLNPTDIMSLLYLSNKFEEEAKRNAQLVDQDELKDLVSEVDALYEAVQASNMPEDVKTFILEQLAAIRHAIRVYPYQGYESLQLALHRSIGSTILFSGRLDQVAQQHPEVNGLKAVMRHLSAVLTKAAEVATIAEPLKPYIARLFGIEGPK